MTTTVLSAHADGLATGAAAILLYAVLGLALMVFAFYVVDWSTPGPLRTYVREGNPGAAVVAGSALVAMALVVVTAIWTSGGDVATGAVHTLVFGVLGIVVQAGAARVLELVLGVDMAAALEARSVTAPAFVVACAHLAFGMIVAVALI